MICTCRAATGIQPPATAQTTESETGARERDTAARGQTVPLKDDISPWSWIDRLCNRSSDGAHTGGEKRKIRMWAIEQKRNLDVGKNKQKKTKQEFGTFRESCRDSNGGRGGGGPRDGESALKVKLDSLRVVMGAG